MSEKTTSAKNCGGRRGSTIQRTKLKGSQLERKRQVDREAQAALRNRTKSRIAHLESLVKALGEDGQAGELVSQINGHRENIERLVDTLGNIRKLVQSALDSPKDTLKIEPSESSTSSPSASNHSNAFLRNNKDTSNRIEEVDEAAEHSSSPMEFLPSSYDPNFCPHGISSKTEPCSNCPDFNHCPDHSTGIGLPLSRRTLEDALGKGSLVARYPSSSSRDVKPDGALWFHINGLMVQALSNRSPTLNLGVEEEDIPIRAVINGWPVVEELYSLDAGWQMVRECDQILFSHLGAIERLAILRMMRLTYVHQVDPQNLAQSIPSFMVARPSEQHVAHDRIVDYFAWPGLRENILFAPRKYSTNRFMDAFRMGFRFLWPLDMSDVFMKNPATGLYSFSPCFVQGQSFLRCWTMHADFFRQYPELARDMPVYDTSRSLTGSYLSLPFAGGAEDYLEELADGERADSTEQDRVNSFQNFVDSSDPFVLWRANAMSSSNFPNQVF